jgi:hypothetical protein
MKDEKVTPAPITTVPPRDVSWIHSGMSVRVGSYAMPESPLKFSTNVGVIGSVMKIEGDYALLYITSNIVKGLPPNEKVPLVQCEQA